MKKIENSSQDLLYYGGVIIDIDPETLDEVHLYNEVIEINNQELLKNPGSIKEEVYKKNIVIVMTRNEMGLYHFSFSPTPPPWILHYDATRVCAHLSASGSRRSGPPCYDLPGGGGSWWPPF